MDENNEVGRADHTPCHISADKAGQHIHSAANRLVYVNEFKIYGIVLSISELT